ncbi:MAG: DUF2442 domain-containing protein [Acidobacteria bacterium]|nr:DUF2442 domain-containing protein [Acidobacteriota bacterium]
MALVRIATVTPLSNFTVRLTLTNGDVVERDLLHLYTGPIFDSIRFSQSLFNEVRVAAGTLVWPSGADLCPDVIIWGGLPPADSSSYAA